MFLIPLNPLYKKGTPPFDKGGGKEGFINIKNPSGI